MICISPYPTAVPNSNLENNKKEVWLVCKKKIKTSVFSGNKGQRAVYVTFDLYFI